jgi:hypothetical protein
MGATVVGDNTATTANAAAEDLHGLQLGYSIRQ